MLDAWYRPDFSVTVTKDRNTALKWGNRRGRNPENCGSRTSRLFFIHGVSGGICHNSEESSLYEITSQ